jgi:hypothetical protein
LLAAVLTAVGDAVTLLITLEGAVVCVQICQLCLDGVQLVHQGLVVGTGGAAAVTLPAAAGLDSIEVQLNIAAAEELQVVYLVL